MCHLYAKTDMIAYIDSLYAANSGNGGEPMDIWTQAMWNGIYVGGVFGFAFLLMLVMWIFPLPDEWVQNYDRNCNLQDLRILTLQFKAFSFVSYSAIYLLLAYIGLMAETMYLLPMMT